MIETEIWEQVDGFENYMISSFGRCKSKNRILVCIKSRGYRTVSLGKGNIRLVHRLVAAAFIPNLKSKPYINHINGIKTDNRYENLEWVTGSENMIHAYKNGLQTPCINQKKAVAKYCVDNYSKKVYQFDLNKNLIKIYHSTSEAARQTGYCQTHIASCCRGKVKTCHDYKFYYHSNPY